MSGNPTLTEAGQKLADALVKAGILSGAGPYYCPHLYVPAPDLNTAAALLFTAPEREGVGLREALDEISCLSPEPDNKTWTTEPWGDPASYQTYDDNGSPREVVPDCDDKADREAFGYERGLHRAAVIARAALVSAANYALASPQPAVEGPVAAGVEFRIPERLIRRAYEHFSHDAEFPCSASAMREAVTLVLRALTPPADPKLTVPGNDAGVREAVIAAARKMPRTTPAPGGTATRHAYEIEAGIIWELDRALMALDALAPQTGSAGEDPKTPDAAKPGAYVADWDAEFREAHAAQPAPVGEDETGVREALAYFLVERQHGTAAADYVREKNCGSWQAAIALADAMIAGPLAGALANQPPKAETLAGVGEAMARVVLIQARELQRLDPTGQTPADLNAAMDDLLTAQRAALSAAPAARPGDGVVYPLPAEGLSELRFFVRAVRALMLHTNPTNVNESHAQQWFAVSDAIINKVAPLLASLYGAAAPAADGGRT